MTLATIDDSRVLLDDPNVTLDGLFLVDPDAETETRGSRNVHLRKITEARTDALGCSLHTATGRVRVEAGQALSAEGYAAGARAHARPGVVTTTAVRVVEVAATAACVAVRAASVVAAAVRAASHMLAPASATLRGGLAATSAACGVLLVGGGLELRAGGARIRAIRNPTDEELIMMIRQRRRQ